MADELTPVSAPSKARPSNADIVASLPDDFGKDPVEVSDDAGEEVGDVQAGDAGGDSVVPALVEAKPAEPPKPEPLSPLIAERAKLEKENRAQREAIKAEREAFQAEKEEWTKSRGNPEEVHRSVRSDIVSWADQQKLTPQERYELARDLAASYLPEEKRPADYRKGSGSVMTEVQKAQKQAAEALEYAKRIETESKQREQEAMSRAQQEAVAAEIVAGIPETSILARSALQKSPKVREQLVQTAIALRDELFAKGLDASEVTAQLTPVAIAARYESQLAEAISWVPKEYWQKLAGTKDTNQTAPRGQSAPNTLSNSVTASPTRASGSPKTAEQRRAEAIASIADD